ncbi:MAG: aspartyl beta-hydroxylase [Methylibium sp.]|nr:aspartyl beta-hydroxylase [Methylibium sp.]
MSLSAVSNAKLATIQGLLASKQFIAAELSLRQLVAEDPRCVDAWLVLADLADMRGDDALVLDCINKARAQDPADERASLQLAETHVRAGRLAEGLEVLEQIVARDPGNFIAWLALGEALEHAGQTEQAGRARYQGVTRGQKAGYLMSMASTPPAWQPHIERIIAHVNAASEACVEQGLAHVRRQFSPGELQRVEHAMAVHLGRLNDAPKSPHQAPKFLFFPGLPEGPFHDPFLQPWAQSLVDAYDDIRAEALGVLAGQSGLLEDFLNFKPGQSKAGYLGGEGSNPSWDAFFFYRHGQSYAANQARCPKTAGALNSADLCRVDGQAPEICFSVLQPGTHIMPHHGVTNTRLVMHLPLIVPGDCALNVRGGGEHAWRERELVMFDDTYEHEAWNRSAQPRVVLLMDCWNPHLTPAERVATKHLVEQISAFENYQPQGLSPLLRP